MKVHLTFDVEVWCGGWDRLDERFEASFERCVIGRSPRGDFALPETLRVLRRHGLRAVFFVEVLFSARFGADWLRRIVELVRADGHEVQLHIHPEWIDEIAEAVIPDRHVKRQHLTYYDLDEQTAIIGFGQRLLREAGVDAIAFRAGSYAANRDTLEALRRNGLLLDSSFNACFPVSGPDLRASHALDVPFVEAGITCYPITTFRDGLGRLRPAQIGACSFEELRDALVNAEAGGLSHFVIVSHSVELMHPRSTVPDDVVLARFERLCAFLATHRSTFDVAGYGAPAIMAAPKPTRERQLRSSASATLRRHVEQTRRAVSHRLARSPRVRPSSLHAPTAGLVIAPTFAPDVASGINSRIVPATSPDPATGAAHVRPPPGLAMRAVVIASRESPEILRAAVERLLVALRGPAAVDVIVNGNPALARATADVDWGAGAGQARVTVWQIDLGDKANAWNRYVHDVWSEAECTFFVDGYVWVRPDALAALAAASRASPEALVASGVPTAGRSAARLRRQMLAEGGVHGNLFMLPAATMQLLRRRGFRLPLGIYRTESTLGAALSFGMEPARVPWSPRRFITVCPAATWDVREASSWSLGRAIAQWNRMQRQAQGELENAAVRALLAERKLDPEQLPATVQDLIAGWLAARPDEVRRTLSHAPLRRSALKRLLQQRDWSLATRGATLLREVDAGPAG